MATIIRKLPERYDYEFWQGDTFAPGTLTASVSGTPINFTGYSAKIEIRNAISDELVLTLTSPSSGITLSSAGVITITMTAAQTSPLIGQYNYDLQITDPNSLVCTYTFGTMTVVSDSTNN